MKRKHKGRRLFWMHKIPNKRKSSVIMHAYQLPVVSKFAEKDFKWKFLLNSF